MNLNKTIDTDNLIVDISKEKLFLGEYSGFLRFETVYDSFIENLTRKMESAMWHAVEVDCSMEKRTFHELDDVSKEIFFNVISYQSLMDSCQTRCLSLDLMPYITSPTLEEAVTTQSYFELIHSKSYSHVIREVFPKPAEIFDKYAVKKEIRHRIDDEINCYINLKNYEGEELKWELLRLLVRIQLLEGVKFYVSFCTTYFLNKNSDNKINNIAKIIRLISFDESMHCVLFSYVLKKLRSDKHEGFSHLFDERFEAMVREESLKVFEDELDWGRYLLSIGSIKGMDIDSIEGFLKYYIDERVTKFKSKPVFGSEPTKANELVKEFKVLNSINSNQMLQESSPLGYSKSFMKFDTKTDIVTDLEEELANLML